ncbi:FadR/GntR family transcriptional regulator [Nonomuraea aridisoli]|uniref:FadR/GntR family transcriptional regulator n=1 Tax=Nonomuraea aridisoli TaxID=2070368 RepID=UPI001F3C7A73|nr:FCD domain-containing protein [Nonomuraea aridisoli]
MFNGVPPTRAEALAADIETMIRERGLGPGDLIGTLDDLRELSGYGRATISEAARLLSDRGTAEIRLGRGGGLFVADPTAVVRLRHTLLTVRSQPTTVADAIAVREALEPLILADAARHRTKKDIADLRRLLTALGRATASTDAFMRANWALHERIAEITPNHLAKAVYLAMTRYVREQSEPAAPGDRPTGYLEHRLTVHTDLVEAIIDGDPARTRTAVTRHHSSEPAPPRPAIDGV